MKDQNGSRPSPDMNPGNTKSRDADCVAFQERLPQMFGAETDFSREPHLKFCENCAELVRDLEYIAQQAKLLMPIHDPSPAVWENIKTALGPTESNTK